MDAKPPRNSYLDLWENVFDELPVSKINEAAMRVEERISSTEDDVVDQPSVHSKSRLADFLEARRKTSKAALKNIQQKILLGTKNKMTLRQLGIPVDESKAQHESMMCFSMQNFGNDDGYTSILAGSDCISQQGDTATATINWKSESTFMIECQRDGNQTTMFGMKHEEVTSTIRAALHGPLEYGLHASCMFSIASRNPWTESHGTGTIVHTRVPLTQGNETHVFHTPLNSINIQMCNLLAESRIVPAIVSLESVKLNGKHLTSQRVLTEPQQSECHRYTYRIPTVAVAEEFLVTGRTKISGDPGPGGSSSIQISIGHLPAI